MATVVTVVGDRGPSPLFDSADRGDRGGRGPSPYAPPRMALATTMRRRATGLTVVGAGRRHMPLPRLAVAMTMREGVLLSHTRGHLRA